MRDPKRIPIVLAKVRELWQTYPDLRLCQLIVILGGVDPFYVEDEKLINLIEDFIHDFPRIKK